MKLARVQRVLMLKELRWVLLVAVLAVAVRAIYFFALVPWTPDAQDRDLYLQIARNVVANRGFSVGLDTDTIVSTSMRPPFPVYFLQLSCGFLVIIHLPLPFQIGG